jgi:hypothetical protein
VGLSFYGRVFEQPHPLQDGLRNGLFVVSLSVVAVLTCPRASRPATDAPVSFPENRREAAPSSVQRFERDTLRFKCRLDDTLDELREVDRLTVTVRNSQPLAGLPRFACPVSVGFSPAR